MKTIRYIPIAVLVATVAIISCKITGTIDWNWWWVLSPLLTLNACVVLALAGIGIYVSVRKSDSTINPKP